jgi:hypothetical protein
MRALLAVIIFISFLAGACHSSKSGAGSPDKSQGQDSLTGVATLDTIKIENDELEYEIIILEIGFNQWLVTQPPMNYWSLNVLEQRNRAYVFEWNQRAANPTAWNPNLYNQFIDYEPTIRYGLEVNYMLYMYFEFFQEKYRQRL